MLFRIWSHMVFRQHKTKRKQRNIVNQHRWWQRMLRMAWPSHATTFAAVPHEGATGPNSSCAQCLLARVCCTAFTLVLWSLIDSWLFAVRLNRVIWAGSLWMDCSNFLSSTLFTNSMSDTNRRIFNGKSRTADVQMNSASYFWRPVRQLTFSLPTASFGFVTIRVLLL